LKGNRRRRKKEEKNGKKADSIENEGLDEIQKEMNKIIIETNKIIKNEKIKTSRDNLKGIGSNRTLSPMQSPRTYLANEEEEIQRTERSEVIIH